MCGICGKLMFDRHAGVSPALLKNMADRMFHRGPDDDGFHISGPVGLGFRRLSIIDLSGGHQPLSNEDGTVWIVFNGEIYNYRELREYLLAKKHIFSTRSDTEVIVHLYEEFGESCVERLRGMFAFAIWDSRKQSLLLARDRVGIKPVYYTASHNSLAFASEIKALLADPDVQPEVSPAMIDRFLSFGYLPGEETLFRNIYKLPPGNIMTIRDGKVENKQYWDLHFSPSKISAGQAQEQLSHLLEESVCLHMISDVPVGFLLSGGLDSTAMLGFASDKTTQPLSAYTIGFSDRNLPDERPYARLAAKRYGVKHHETTIGPAQFADFLPQYVSVMEEPVCEPPAVALYYVSKLAREHVKVLISGEGGDEAFAGYSNYRSILWIERLKRLLSPFNGSVPKTLSAFGRFIHSERLQKYAPYFGAPFEDYYYSRASSPFRIFNANSDLYSTDFLCSLDKKSSISPATRYLANGHGADVLSKMLYVDTKIWLPDDLLIKADKITMANSIELRVPLLDHKVLEFAASLPSNFKVRGFATKWIAKRALKDRVPREIVTRKKAGFPVPYESWLRNDLKDWVRGLLLDRKTVARGYFRTNQIEMLLSENLRSGAYSKEIFSLVVLELWNRDFIDKKNLEVPMPSSPNFQCLSAAL